MKKTIKYGGVALGAVAAMGGGASAFADTNVATGVDGTTCTVTTASVADETAKTSDSLQAEANAYNAAATCVNNKATVLTGQIKTEAESLDIYETKQGAADYDAINAAADALVAEIKEDLGIEDFSDASYKIALGKGSEEENTPWALAVAADGGDQLNDNGIVARIEADPTTYGANMIIADFTDAKDTLALKEKIAERAETVAKAEELAEKAAFYQNAATKAAAAEAAAADAKTAADEAKAVINYVRHSLIGAEEHFDAETMAALESALEKAKNGEKEDLTELFERLGATAEAAAQAATDLADAQATADDAAIALADAIADQETAADELTAAQGARDTAADAVQTAEETVAAKQEAYDAALTAKNQKDAIVAQKQAALQAAQEGEDQDAIDAAETALEAAQDEASDAATALTTAQNELATANADLTSARNALAAAEGALTAAQAAKDAADADVDAKTTAKGAADAAVTTAQAAKDAADAAAEEDEDVLMGAAFIAGAISEAADKVVAANEAKAAADVAEAAAAEARGETPVGPGTTDPEEPGTTDPEEPGTDEPGTTEDVDTDGKPYDYSVLSGDGKVWTTDGETLSFRFKAPFALFDYIVLDGEPVGIDTGLYSVKEGSTIVTLSKELLDSLSEGEHTLAAVFTNGEISEVANFTIKAAEVEVKAPETGVYTAETSAAISSFVTAFMAATIAGAAVVIRKRA